MMICRSTTQKTHIPKLSTVGSCSGRGTPRRLNDSSCLAMMATMVRSSSDRSLYSFNASNLARSSEGLISRITLLAGGGGETERKFVDRLPVLSRCQ